MQDFELYHYGIPGQKWGKRNGPPYPLSTRVANAIKKGAKATASGVKKTYRTGLKVYDTVSKVNEDIHHRRMMKVIQKGSFKDLIKHADEYNAEELMAAKERLGLLKQIRDIKFNDKELGKNGIEKGIEYLKLGASAFTSADSISRAMDAMSTRQGAKGLNQLKSQLDTLNTQNSIRRAKSEAKGNELNKLKASTAQGYYNRLSKEVGSITGGAAGSISAQDAARLKTILDDMDKIRKMFD